MPSINPEFEELFKFLLKFKEKLREYEREGEKLRKMASQLDDMLQESSLRRKFDV